MSVSAPHNLFASLSAPLCLGDAVAAVIVDEYGRYLLQQRDDKPGIFYPAHWGLFGGGIEPGESDEQALRRELLEELDFSPQKLVPLQSLSFDLTQMGGGCYRRCYMEISIKADAVLEMTLNEGNAMAVFEAETLLVNKLVAPYDSFAIWLHYAASNGLIRV